MCQTTLTDAGGEDHNKNNGGPISDYSAIATGGDKAGGGGGVGGGGVPAPVREEGRGAGPTWWMLSTINEWGYPRAMCFGN